MSDSVITLADIQAERDRRRSNKIRSFFPDEGPLSRDKYPQHMEFFRAGKEFNERLFLCGNRVGKTEAGSYETTLHLTGLYDDIAPWWDGRRFPKPIKAWAAGDTNETVRNILQFKLLGLPGEYGTGMIPKDCIYDIKTKGGGVKDAIDQVYVKHKTGGISILQFKSYEQGRKSFQGTEQDFIFLDEEPPMDVYLECLTRLMTTRGSLIMTFTPLSGWSEVVSAFLDNEEIPSE